MKLDNKGWGMNTLIILICVIVVALLISTFFAIRLNKMIGNQNNKSEQKVEQAISKAVKDYYIIRQNRMTEAAEEYIKKEQITITKNKTKIYLSTLVSKGYTNEITDYESGRKCDGYSIAYKNPNDITIIDSYLNCDNYKTKGYGEN